MSASLISVDSEITIKTEMGIEGKLKSLKPY